MRIFSSLHLLAALGALGAAAGASAQVDTSQWKCTSCPYPKGTTGSVDAGASKMIAPRDRSLFVLDRGHRLPIGQARIATDRDGRLLGNARFDEAPERHGITALGSRDSR